MPLSLSISLHSLCLREPEGGHTKVQEALSSGKGEERNKKNSETMPPADADDSLGKNSRYYKVGSASRLCVGEARLRGLSARGVSVRSCGGLAETRESE